MKKRYVIEFTVEAEDCSDEWIKDQALQELTCMSPFPEDIDFYRKDNPWHTGIPTEAGWYVFDFGSSGGQYENLVSLEYLSIHQIERYKRTNRFKDTKWQKIDLEKGN